MNFVWQYLDPIEQAMAVQNIIELLNPGGFLITEAKIECHENQLKLVEENNKIKKYVLLP